MWTWLNQNAGGVQAFSAVLSLTVTIILAIITYVALKLTRRALKLSQRQLMAGLHPQVLITMGDVSWSGKDKAKTQFTISNAGTHYFRLLAVAFDYYCSTSESTAVEPREFGLLAYRVATKDDHIDIPIDLDLRGGCLFHEDHPGDCTWVFRLNVTVDDLFGSCKYDYYFDSVLGMHYCKPYEQPEGVSLRRSWSRWALKSRFLKLKLKNAYRHYRSRRKPTP